MHTYLGILLRCRFSKFGMEPHILHISSKLPGDADAAGPRTTHWGATVQSTRRPLPVLSILQVHRWHSWPLLPRRATPVREVRSITVHLPNPVPSLHLATYLKLFQVQGGIYIHEIFFNSLFSPSLSSDLQSPVISGLQWSFFSKVFSSIEIYSLAWHRSLMTFGWNLNEL